MRIQIQSRDVKTPVATPANYKMLSADTAVDYLSRLEIATELLGDTIEDWTVREIGDGNLNFVFHVQSPRGAVIAKQALPYIRARGEDWPLPLSRAHFEFEALTREEQRASGMTPRAYYFDAELALTVMEFLSPHIILRKGFVKGRRYPDLATDMGTFLAKTLFRGSRFAMADDIWSSDKALFEGNRALCAVTEARVFTEPYVDAELNRWTSPQLDEEVARIRNDDALKSGIATMKSLYASSPQSLLHGDLHSGSIMVTEEDTRVIDPEFAFCGPMAFDIGALMANYLIAYLAQPAHATIDNDRVEYSDWILETVVLTWTTFANEFADLWNSKENIAKNEATTVKQFLDVTLKDSIGFAAAKMIRRIIGAAHVEDLESIHDADLRSEREKAVLRLARTLLLNRQTYSTIDEVTSAARKAH